MAQLVDAWSDLPEHAKDAIKAIVRPYLPSEGSDFANDFATSFDRLDRQGGSRNYISLVDLRLTLPGYDRSAFDAGVAELRRAGKFTLSAAEGRHGIGPEQQEAGIRENGALLLWVSKR